MYKITNGILLPNNAFPGVENTYRAYDDIDLVSICEHTDAIDPKVEGIINNPDIKIATDTAFKKSIQANAQLISTYREGVDSCSYALISKKDLKYIKVARVKDVMRCCLAQTRTQLEKLMLFDDISLNDFVFIPNKQYTWGQKDNQYWYTEYSFTEHIENLPNTYIGVRSKTPIDFASAVYYSNNRPVNTEELIKIKKVLSFEDTRMMALEVMNMLNPMISFPEMLVAYNCIPDEIKKKNKAKILPLMQEIFNLNVNRPPFRIEEICNLYRRFFQKEPSPEQLEFLADHYESAYNEKASLFNFKVTIK
jgi:hypothetical protein